MIDFPQPPLTDLSSLQVPAIAALFRQGSGKTTAKALRLIDNINKTPMNPLDDNRWKYAHQLKLAVNRWQGAQSRNLGIDVILIYYVKSVLSDHRQSPYIT